MYPCNNENFNKFLIIFSYKLRSLINPTGKCKLLNTLLFFLQTNFNNYNFSFYVYEISFIFYRNTR